RLSSDLPLLINLRYASFSVEKSTISGLAVTINKFFSDCDSKKSFIRSRISVSVTLSNKTDNTFTFYNLLALVIISYLLTQFFFSLLYNILLVILIPFIYHILLY